MQQALPTTFGLKVAGWLRELDGARRGLERIGGRLPLQLGGPIGALHGPIGPDGVPPGLRRVW